MGGLKCNILPVEDHEMNSDTLTARDTRKETFSRYSAYHDLKWKFDVSKQSPLSGTLGSKNTMEKSTNLFENN